MSELRDRIADVIARHRMDRSNYEMADAVIAELGAIPDREFDDPWGHHWEWCGGVTETWAWRVTRLEGRR
jgi:hypothetical protein